MVTTRDKILEAGKREFLVKGFKDASLRHIVKEAGFTQGAFYGLFPDKAALFETIVASAAEGLMDRFRAAQDAHFDLIPQGKASSSYQLSTEYLRQFLQYLYDNLDAFKLIICCSEGTKYAFYLHDLVELEVTQTERFWAHLAEQGKLQGTVSRKLHHMITSAYFSAVFEAIVHDMDYEEALSYAEELATFFTCGWEGLMKIS